MANNTPSLVADTKLTPIADTKGHIVLICNPPWFDERKKFRIANAPQRTLSLEFNGADLNYLARVVYAEASGALQLPDDKERIKEKKAILNVNHFRLNRKGYPNNSYVAKTFRQVCDAPGQFESVFAVSPKFSSAEKSKAEKLRLRECADLSEAIEAILKFMTNGPDIHLQFDNFRGFDPNGHGTPIGRSRFWLSSEGARMLSEKT